MSETAHTPGPWVVRDDGITAAILAGPDEKQIISVTWANGHQSANARLIAAAPDMLALLKELIDIEGPQPGTSDWARKVNAAIAQAESQS